MKTKTIYTKLFRTPQFKPDTESNLIERKVFEVDGLPNWYTLEPLKLGCVLSRETKIPTIDVWYINESVNDKFCISGRFQHFVLPEFFMVNGLHHNRIGEMSDLDVKKMAKSLRADALNSVDDWQGFYDERLANLREGM